MSTKRSTIIDLAHPHVVSDVKLIMRRVLCHDDDCDVSDDLMCLTIGVSVRFACGVVAATSFDVEDCGTKVSACKIGRRAVVERLKWWCGERGVLSVKICQHCFGEKCRPKCSKKSKSAKCCRTTCQH